MSEKNLKRNITTALLSLDGQIQVGERMVAEILRDVLGEVAGLPCEKVRDRLKRGIRNPLPCGSCIVCVAREVVKG